MTTDWLFKPDTRVIDKRRLKRPSCDIEFCVENSSSFVVDILTKKTSTRKMGEIQFNCKKQTPSSLFVKMAAIP